MRNIRGMKDAQEIISSLYFPDLVNPSREISRSRSSLRKSRAWQAERKASNILILTKSVDIPATNALLPSYSSLLTSNSNMTMIAETSILYRSTRSLLFFIPQLGIIHVWHFLNAVPELFSLIMLTERTVIHPVSWMVRYWYRCCSSIRTSNLWSDHRCFDTKKVNQVIAFFHPGILHYRIFDARQNPFQGLCLIRNWPLEQL